MKMRVRRLYRPLVADCSKHVGAEVNPVARVSQNSSLLFAQNKTAGATRLSGLISEISRRFAPS